MATKIIEEGQLEGEFNGFNNTDTIFKFFAGGKWRQAEYNYYYHYAYMPDAKVILENNSYFLIVEEVDEKIEVIPF